MNQFNEETKTVNGKEVTIDHRIAIFSIYQKSSGSVDYFGFDRNNNRVFVQFKYGTSSSYIYNDVPAEVIDAAENADSIGSFVSLNLVNKYAMEKIMDRLVKPSDSSFGRKLC